MVLYKKLEGGTYERKKFSQKIDYDIIYISKITGDVRLHAKTKAEQKFFVDSKRDINQY